MMKKNKVLIVSLSNIFTTPYINYYLIQDESLEYDLFYWNRENIDENTDFAAHTIEFKSKKNFFSYFRFASKLLKTIKSNNYDKIIFLHTLSAVLIAGYLSKKFKQKYIVDIRDYTLERNHIFFDREEKVIKNAYLTVISSPFYIHFLPKHYNYSVLHNFAKPVSLNKNVKRTNKIIVSNIGYIRFFEMNIKVLNYFKNDDRFLMKYVGHNSETIAKYCKENNIHNVEFVGRFEPNDTPLYFSEADIVFNVYGNSDISLDYALSNKLYYAAFFKKPILVSKNTAMEELSIKYGFGITFDEKETIADDVYNKYIGFQKDFDSVSKKCDSFIDDVMNTNNNTEKKIKAFLEIER